jgi:hypothetical protein
VVGRPATDGHAITRVKAAREGRRVALGDESELSARLTTSVREEAVDPPA